MRGMNLVGVGLVAGAILSLAPACAVAQHYPSRPVRFIVPFPPGGGNDIVGRVIALRLADALGQPVIVDNRGGAGGTLGTDITAKSPADGYTLLINNISLAVNATLFAKLPVRHAERSCPGHPGRTPAQLAGRSSVGGCAIDSRAAGIWPKPGRASSTMDPVGSAQRRIWQRNS